MSDAPALFALRSDPEVMRFVHRPRAVTSADAEAFIHLPQGLVSDPASPLYGFGYTP